MSAMNPRPSIPGRYKGVYTCVDKYTILPGLIKNDFHH